MTNEIKDEIDRIIDLKKQNQQLDAEIAELRYIKFLQERFVDITDKLHYQSKNNYNNLLFSNIYGGIEDYIKLCKSNAIKKIKMW